MLTRTAPLAQKFSDLGMALYATPGTAEEIALMGIDVTAVPPVSKSDELRRNSWNASLT